jgi:TPR repeat protein
MKRFHVMWLLAVIGVLGGMRFAVAQTSQALPKLTVQLIQSGPAPGDDSLSHDDSHCTPCDGVRLMNAGDYVRAMRIFQEWAAKGDTNAMNDIGWMYANGLGMPVNAEQAAAWYSKAAKVGNPVGYTNLGRMYQHGQGVPVDYDKAMQLYLEAASQHESVAMNQIGFMFQHGLGSPPEPDAAYVYYKMAQRAGYEPAIVHIQELIASGTLNPRTITAADDRASAAASRPVTP